MCLCVHCYMLLLDRSYGGWYFWVKWWFNLIVNLEWQGQQQLYVIIWVIHSCSSQLLLRIWLLLPLPERLVSLTVKGLCCIYGRSAHRCVTFLSFDYEHSGVRYFVLIIFSLIFNFSHCIFWQDVIHVG